MKSLMTGTAWQEKTQTPPAFESQTSWAFVESLSEFHL